MTRLIKLAGGTTQAADIRQVEIRRQRSINSGGNEVIKVDLVQLVQSGDIQQDLRLRDGDSIFIPSTTSANLDEARQLASTNFAAVTNRPLRIAVVGEVNRPGPYTLTEKPEAPVDGTGSAPNVQVPTVTQAIQTAGGITQSADIRNIQVRRMTKTGPEQTIKIDFWRLLQSGDLRQDLPLQDGDTIVIPTATALSPSEATKLASASFAPGKITVNVVGEVVKPGPVEVPPNTPLSQALLAAGGFNARARKQSVTFIRLNPNGTVSQRAIAIDFSKGINDETNPALRNNDTIIVGKSTIAGITDTLGSFLSPVTGVLGLIRLLSF
ncbi:MAG: SLBB domain-containing protein [Leptolyngbyaceae cyanobacterium HOT.MB2.61]|nr:SLBB domain-containing protein [Leptolyngbyaceae cyanobacterium HOT.MB2.61]